MLPKQANACANMAFGFLIADEAIVAAMFDKCCDAPRRVFG
jgi:hypothetical protein